MARAVTQFSPLDAGEKISADEFATADFQPPFRYERVQGRLVVMSPAGPEHRQVSKPFRRELGLYWGQHQDIVDDVDVEGWVTISDETERIPDICVYLTDRDNDDTVPRRVPDLIFEFVSADRSDQERNSYGAHWQLSGGPVNHEHESRRVSCGIDRLPHDQLKWFHHYIDKRGDYHAIGVPEYVIVDRFKRTALVLTWREGDFAERVLAETEAYETPLLPGLRVPLAEAFLES